MSDFENVAMKRIAAMGHEIASMQEQLNAVSQGMLDVDSLAGKRVPFHYVIPIQITQGSAEQVENSVSTSRSGPFFAEKLVCTFRIEAVQDGGDASWVGRFLPLSSRPDYPYLTMWAAGATGTQVVDPPLDFEFGWESNASDRQRQDKNIPGDILSKFDNDGIMPVSDIFPGGSTITFKVNPYRAVGNNAPWNTATGVDTYIFEAVFVGYKIIQPTQV
jgi:hypothetical protein